MRNVDIRENFIKNFSGNKGRAHGEKLFLEISERDSKFKKLLDIPCPAEYSWIFKHFMQIWQQCEYDMGGGIIFTYKTVNDYVECMKVPFTVEDKKCLFRMKGWALETIAELKDKNKEL